MVSPLFKGNLSERFYSSFYRQITLHGRILVLVRDPNGAHEEEKENLLGYRASI